MNIDIKNSKLLFVLCAIVIIYVLLMSAFMIRKAWRRGKELEMDTEIMKKVLINSVLVSILPSLPIIISLFIIMKGLGRFFAWLRLSILGSAQYETMVASQVAESFGLQGISDPAFNGDIFISAMWAMTIAIMGGLIFAIFFLGPIDRRLKAASTGKNEKIMPIYLGALFPALLAIFAAPIVLNVGNIDGIVAFLVSSISVLILSKISKKTGIKTLNEFAFPLSLVIGMASVIIWHL